MVCRAAACDTGVVLAENFSDPENARIIFFAAGGLLVMAIGVAVGTVLWWRSSAVEHPALAPLEVMSSKSWMRADEEDRVDRLDAVRPFDEPAPVAPARATTVRRAPVAPKPELFDDPLDDDWGADPEDPLYGPHDDEAAVDEDERYLDEDGDDWEAPPPQRRPIDPLMRSDDLW